MANDHYYNLLEIKCDASRAQIASAYRKLALKNHPLRNSKSQLAEFQNKFTKVSEAYDILSQPAYRKLYDERGDDALRNGIMEGEDEIGGYTYNGDAYMIFKEFFGSDNPYFETIE